MSTRRLLIVTALGEGAVGLILVVWPSVLVWVLLGTTIDNLSGLIICRVAGAALLALALACWVARQDGSSDAARGLVAGMLVYSALVAALLVYASWGYGLSGIGLWPAVILHTALAVWCASLLFMRR